MVPTILGVVLLIFAVTQIFSPVQRASLYISDPKALSAIPEVIKMYHLDEPAHIQFSYWIKEVLSGNLGYSISANMRVTEAIIVKAPATAELVIFSIPITVFLGIYLGIKSAIHRDKFIDHATRTLAIIGWSLPSFWLGLVLISVFFGVLHWFPPGRLGTAADIVVHSPQYAFIQYTGLNTIDGLLNGQLWITVDALRHMVLPVIVLTTIQIAMIIRVMRSSMLEALGKAYITTARAKGLTQNEVINKHARRNALIPVITLAGLLTAGMLTGVIITETVFAVPGLGRWSAQAAMTLDIPGVLGFALFSAFIFVIANLIVDITYAYIDPRIRLA